MSVFFKFAHMKNVIFKALFCLIPFAFVACGDDSSSAGDAETVSDAGVLVPGKCIVRNFRGFEKIDCSDFSLNESDSSYTFSITVPEGICSGSDVEHLSWRTETIKMNYKYKYSIHGDTMYTRLVKETVDTDDEFIRQQYSMPERDSMYSVTEYVSRSHQGAKGTWKYVTAYHESPSVTVNPYMDNVMVFMSIGEDAFLIESVPNADYSFAKSVLVERMLLALYNNSSDFGGISPVYAGYVGYLYPYDNPAVDIKLVSESANKVAFKVNGENVVFSNISSDLNYFVKSVLSFDLEYAGQKCSYYNGFERISQKTCKSELAESLEMDFEYEYEYDEYGYRDYDSRKVVRVDAFYYEYGPEKDDFRPCFRKMLGDDPVYDY